MLAANVQVNQGTGDQFQHYTALVNKYLGRASEEVAAYRITEDRNFGAS